jgi:hypothetical protein
MRWRPAYTESEVRDAVENAISLSGALRRLGLRPAGGNFGTLKKLIEHYGISTDHFDPNWVLRGQRIHSRIPLDEVLVEASTYHRGKLKNRLYAAGLKTRECEICGQGELWRGQRMALILDHANGVGDDNRLENLRIVCPNCAATLETHCGRKNVVRLTPRPCLRCGVEFLPKYRDQRYCSQDCGSRHPRTREPRPESRKVSRPPYEQLVAEIEALGYRAVGRRYGVSDSAVRKWVRWYRARLAAPGGEEAAA